MPKTTSSPSKGLKKGGEKPSDGAKAKPKSKGSTKPRKVTDEPKYVVKKYMRGETVVKQYGVYEKARRMDGTYYMKYRIISKDEAMAAKEKGKIIKDEKREQKILHKGDEVKEDKAAGIKGKKPSLITESDIEFIANKYSVVPSKVTAIIQHVDGVIISDLTEATRR